MELQYPVRPPLKVAEGVAEKVKEEMDGSPSLAEHPQPEMSPVCVLRTVRVHEARPLTQMLKTVQRQVVRRRPAQRQLPLDLLVQLPQAAG